MKIKILIALGLSVALSGCMGIVSGKEPHPEPQSISDQGNRAITNFEFQGKNSKSLMNLPVYLRVCFFGGYFI